MNSSFSSRLPRRRLPLRRWILIAPPLLLTLPLLALLAGCGGSSGSSGTGTVRSSAQGQARFTVLWPSRDSSSGRLIPFAANSIQVQITSADGKSLFNSALIVRPSGGGAASASFDNLPVGTALVTATAYPNAEGSGISQATARVPVTIVQNVVTPVSLTMASTIASVAVTPTTQSLSPGGTVALVATPKDASGNVVLISPSTLSWTTSPSSSTVATVAPTGIVTAGVAGKVTIVATETESSKSGTASVIVGPPVAAAISFASPVTYSCPSAGGLFSGDFDNDGNIDLAVTSGQNLVIYYGKGDGTLNAPVTIFTGTDSPAVRAVGDLNNDGQLDLVCSSSSNNVYVLLNTGNHTFKSVMATGVGSPTFSAAIADFDRDGYKDIAVSYQPAWQGYGGGIAILKNSGGTSFGVTKTYGLSGITESVAAGDLNGDGKADLVGTFVTSTINDSGFTVFLGKGDGTFTSGNTYRTATENVPIPEIADFNNDGIPDVTVDDYFDNNEGVLLGKGDGTFGAVAKYADAPYPNICPPVDLDGDNYLDIVTVNAGTNTMTYLRNKGDGTFAAGVQVPSGISAVLACHAVDLNKDGRPDVIVTGLDSLNVLINTSK